MNVDSSVLARAPLFSDAAFNEIQRAFSASSLPSFAVYTRNSKTRFSFMLRAYHPGDQHVMQRRC